MTRSEELFERARRVIPGGVNSPVRAFGAVGGTPRFAVRGEGAYVVDADGHRYVDLVQSWGALLFGHARPEIVEAARAAAERGTTFGAPTEARGRARRTHHGGHALDRDGPARLERDRGRDERDPPGAGVHRPRSRGEVRGLLPRALGRAARGGRRERRGDARDPRLAGRDRGSGARHAHRARTTTSRRSTTRDRAARRRDRRRHRRTRRRQHGRRAARARVPRTPARALHRERRAARVRRGDHRLPGRVRRRAGRVRR